MPILNLPTSLPTLIYLWPVIKITGFFCICAAFYNSNMQFLKNTHLLPTSNFLIMNFRYSNSSTFSGGLPMTAFSPSVTIGRSISIGFSAIAWINSASGDALDNPSSAKHFSFVRIIPMGLSYNCFNKILICNSVNGDCKYPTTLSEQFFSCKIFNASRDFEQCGLW